MAVEDVSNVVGAGSGGVTEGGGGGGGGGGGIDLVDVTNAYRVEEKTISAAAILNKYVDLNSPLAGTSKVHVSVVNGPPLQSGVDFNANGVDNRIEWNALALDGLIEENDVLRIVYFTS